jgi:Polyketide cyclase / dehydrase and lipid transport
MGQRPFTFVSQVTAESSAPPEVVYDTVADLRAHLEWSGERAEDDTFKLLSIDASSEPAIVGTTFTSSGANFNGTFHDRSVIAEATRPSVFVIETDATLERKHGRTWEVHFTHRYDVEPRDGGSRITYTETISRLNYVPYWLQFWLRPISKAVIVRADTKQLKNLARLAEERSGTER